MSSGFYLLHRGWRDNPVFKDEPMTERELWVWIIENANYKASNYYHNQKPYVIERGCLAVSIRRIMTVSGWSQQRVSGFMQKLKNEGMITTVQSKPFTLIMLKNYGRYQVGADTRSDTPNDTPADTGNDTHPDTHLKKEKERKESKLNNGRSKTAGQRITQKLSLGDDQNGIIPEQWLDYTTDKYGWSEGYCQQVFDGFCDYWRGVSGQRGSKLDWYATWRNWCGRQTPEGERGRTMAGKGAGVSDRACATEAIKRVLAKGDDPTNHL